MLNIACDESNTALALVSLTYLKPNSLKGQTAWTENMVVLRTFCCS